MCMKRTYTSDALGKRDILVKVLMNETERAEVQTEAILSGCSVAEVIRRAIKEHVGRRA